MSLATDIADALVKDLNDQTSFSKTVAAERGYHLLIDLATFSGNRVLIAPKDKTRTATASRGLDRRDLRIDVAVQAKIAARPGEDTAELDGWLDYVDELEEFLLRRRPSTMPSVVVASVENAPIFAPEHLEPAQVFSSLLTVTFQVNWSRT